MHIVKLQQLAEHAARVSGAGRRASNRFSLDGWLFQFFSYGSRTKALVTLMRLACCF